MPKNVEINIPAPDIQNAEVEIVGTSPIIFHKWSEKTKRQMLDKHLKRAKSNTAKAAREPVKEYLETFYKDEDGYIVFPANNLKQAVVAAARNVDDLPMTLLRGAVFIEGDQDGLVKVLHQGKPIKASKTVDKYPEDDRPEGLYAKDKKLPDVIQMRQDMVRVGRGAADIRFRGQVTDWHMKFNIRWNNDVLSLEQILNLIQIAGFACGIGEWRPQKDGKNGMFSLKN